MLSYTDLVGFSYQVANGMEFLASKNVCVILMGARQNCGKRRQLANQSLPHSWPYETAPDPLMGKGIEKPHTWEGTHFY